MASLNYVNTLIQILLKTYFSNSRCIFTLSDSFKDIEAQLEIPTVYIKVHNTLNPHLIFQNYGCQDIIIFHENASNIFINFEKLIWSNGERFNSRKYIIAGKNSIDIFSTKGIEYVSNILVIVPKQMDDGTERYDLLTHRYSHKDKPNEAITVDSWFPQNRTFLHGYDLFPDKLSNQNGRKVKIGNVPFKPYSILGDDNKTFHGTEDIFISKLVKKHNITPILSISDGDEMWGDIYENGTGFGLVMSLVNDEVDLIYGGFIVIGDYHRYLDFSTSLERLGMCILVPLPRLIANWFTPLQPFSLTIWMGILLVLISDTTVLSCLFYIKNKRWCIQESIMTTIRLYLLQPAKIRINQKLIKYFIALNMMHILLLSASYSGGLSSTMTVPRYKNDINTVDDLVQSGLLWGASKDGWTSSLRNIEEENYKTLVKRFVVKTDEELIELSKTRNFGFVMDRLQYGYYGAFSYLKPNIISKYKVMKNDIFWIYSTMMVRKNSVLLPLLDKMIVRVFEAGLVASWQNKVIFEFMDMSVQRRLKYSTHRIKKRSKVKLRWAHLQGAFAILLIGYIFSGLTCLIELIVNSHHRNLHYIP